MRRLCWLAIGLIINALLSACAPIEIEFQTLTPETIVIAEATGTAAAFSTAAPDATAPTQTGEATSAEATGLALYNLTPTPPLDFTATETPRAAVSNIQRSPVPIATASATPTAPSFTPLPGWARFVSDKHGLQFQYPMHWQPSTSPGYRFEGPDGFFDLGATNSQDNLLTNACQDMARAGYGSAPSIEWLTVQEQEACLVISSPDQSQDLRGQSALVVRFPEPRDHLVPGVRYVFLVLWADLGHIRALKDTLEFLPPTTITPTPDPSVPTATPDAPILIKDGETYYLFSEQMKGAYTVRMWRRDLSTCLFGLVTITAEGQTEVQVPGACTLIDLPVRDVTGEGDPDVLIETDTGGGSSRTWGWKLYNLGAAPRQMLHLWGAGYTHPGADAFQDLDHDARLEILAYTTGLFCSQARQRVVLQYDPARGYVPASPRFASVYAESSAAQTQALEAKLANSESIDRCGVQGLVLDYLYSGQPDRAWTAFERYYKESDAAEVRAIIEQAVNQNPLFVPSATP